MQKIIYININSLTTLKTFKQFRKILLFGQKMCQSFKLVPWLGAWLFMGQPFNYDRISETCITKKCQHLCSCVQYKNNTFPKFKACFSHERRLCALWEVGRQGECDAQAARRWHIDESFVHPHTFPQIYINLYVNEARERGPGTKFSPFEFLNLGSARFFGSMTKA